MKLMKYMIFVFNFIFWLSGLGLIVFGIVIKIQGSRYYNFLGNSFLAMSILLIVIGSVIAVLSFFGCCGAIRENYCMTMTFAVLLGILFILQLAAGIAAYVLRNDLENTLTQQVSDGMDNYANASFPSDVYTQAWDYMQKQLNCCGTINYTDWHTKAAFKAFPLTENNHYILPYSCCEGNTKDDACDSGSTELHQNGCIDQLKRLGESNAIYVGSVALGIALIQIIGSVLAYFFAGMIQDDDGYFSNYYRGYY